ncbi:MAG TPA: carbohydrate kinase, partial [Fibrella sp.]
LFGQTFANLSGAAVELYNTDGAQGAARGAGLGLGHYANRDEAFSGLSVVRTLDPDLGVQQAYQEAYANWLAVLEKQ